MKVVVTDADRGVVVLYRCEERRLRVFLELDPGGTEDLSELPADIRDELAGTVEPLLALVLGDHETSDERLVLRLRVAQESGREEPAVDLLQVEAGYLRLVKRGDVVEQVLRDGTSRPVSRRVAAIVDLEGRLLRPEPDAAPGEVDLLPMLAELLEKHQVWDELAHRWEHARGDHDHDHDHDGEDDDDWDDGEDDEEEPGDWREEDWSWWKPGDLVPFGTISGSYDPPMRHKGKDYDAADFYCVTPGCSCRALVVSFVPVDSDDEIGSVEFDVRDQEVLEVRATKARRPLVDALWERYRQIHGLRQLRDRQREMRLHAPTIARLAGQEAPAPAAPVGPNDPCPCGSGKKHKHCCMV